MIKKIILSLLIISNYSYAQIVVSSEYLENFKENKPYLIKKTENAVEFTYFKNLDSKAENWLIKCDSSKDVSTGFDKLTCSVEDENIMIVVFDDSTRGLLLNDTKGRIITNNFVNLKIDSNRPIKNLDAMNLSLKNPTIIIDMIKRGKILNYSWKSQYWNNEGDVEQKNVNLEGLAESLKFIDKLMADNTQ